MRLAKLSIADVPIAGKRVFMRVDFNVPLDQQGHVTDDTRIRASLPTIQYATARGAKVILASHLGRPAGKIEPRYSLKPVAECLSGLLGKNIPLADDCVGPTVEALVGQMHAGEVLLLENLRFHAGGRKERCPSLRSSWRGWRMSTSTTPLAPHTAPTPRPRG